MKTNVKKLLKKYLTNKQLFKHFGLLCFVPLFFSSCAGRKFISEAKWKDKHIVYFKTNQENVTVKNKKGEKLEQASDGWDRLTIAGWFQARRKQIPHDHLLSVSDLLDYIYIKRLIIS